MITATEAKELYESCVDIDEVYEFMKNIESVQFDYSELSAEELEEEIKMYTEDMKKLRKALVEKKKESEAVASSNPVTKVKKPSRVSKEVPKELSNN